MTAKRGARIGLPLLLASLTFVLVLFVLWPQDIPTTEVVIAARDLGAGSVLNPADLTVITLPIDQIGQDRINDPVPLYGQTLAVVRFQGEPITTRHIGPSLSLHPHERAVSLQVGQDQGLAGILRPGMRVGVVATLSDLDGNIYAKAMLEDLRVLYVSPDFQARPQLPVAAVQSETGNQPTPIRPYNEISSQEGIVIVAAPVDPHPLTYVPITETQSLTQSLTTAVGSASSDFYTITPPHSPIAQPDMANAQRTWVTPVELLAALNAQDQAFTLVLMPETPDTYMSAGVRLLDIVPVPSFYEEDLP